MNKYLSLHHQDTRGLDPMKRQVSDQSLALPTNRIPVAPQASPYGRDTRGLDPMNPDHMRRWRENQEADHEDARVVRRAERLAKVQIDALALQREIELEYQKRAAALDRQVIADHETALEKLKQQQAEMIDFAKKTLDEL